MDLSLKSHKWDGEAGMGRGDAVSAPSPLLLATRRQAGSFWLHWASKHGQWGLWER